MSAEFFVQWNEDGSATALGRITARNGSGAATGKDGEGNFLQQADVTSIAAKVFDLDSETPNTPTDTETLTVSSVVLDTVVTTNVIWTKDSIGYNFLHDLSHTYFPEGGRRYRVEYKVVLADDQQFHGSYSGPASPIRSS